jgi:hypothetical protein
MQQEWGREETNTGGQSHPHRPVSGSRSRFHPGGSGGPASAGCTPQFQRHTRARTRSHTLECYTTTDRRRRRCATRSPLWRREYHEQGRQTRTRRPDATCSNVAVRHAARALRTHTWSDIAWCSATRCGRGRAHAAHRPPHPTPHTHIGRRLLPRHFVRLLVPEVRETRLVVQNHLPVRRQVRRRLRQPRGTRSNAKVTHGDGAHLARPAPHTRTRRAEGVERRASRHTKGGNTCSTPR